MELPQECIRSGSLEVQSTETNDWNSYYFRLIGHNKDDATLEYFDNNSSATPINTIKLQGSTINSSKEMIEIRSPNNILFLCSENEKIALSWEHILRDVIDGSYFQSEGSAESDNEGEGSGDESDEELIYCPINNASAYNKYNIFNKVKDFSRYFIDKGILYLNKKALHKGLDNCSVRSIYWKVQLGILPQDSPSSSWPAVLSMLRVKYNELKKEYLLNPEDITRSSSSKHLSNTEDDEEKGNYLFETQQLELTIRKDITRTFSSFTFFQEPNIQDLFVRVLMVTSKMRKDIGYQQGLSEILAVIFFLLYIERIEGSNLGRLDVMGDEYGATSGISCNSYLSRAEKEEIDQEILGIRYYSELPSSKSIKNKIPEDQKDVLELLYVLMNGDFIEHDAFLLLNSMIDRMANIYAPVNEQAKSALFLANKLADLQSRLLRTIDPDVTDALEENDITGHMYLLKWIRILFAREFRMPSVWTLWDAIFTLTPDDFSLDNYVCLAMLEEVRDDICVEDTAGILKLLKNSFEDCPIRDIIDKALEYEQQLGQMTPVLDDDDDDDYDSNDDYDEDGVRKWKDGGNEENDSLGDDDDDDDEINGMTEQQKRNMRSSFSFSFEDVGDVDENV